MKLILLILLLSISINAQQFKAYKLNSNLQNSHKLNENTYLIEGDKESCLLYYSESGKFKEIFTDLNSDINSIVLLDNMLYIANGKILTVVNIENNSFKKDTLVNQYITCLFEYNQKVYLCNQEFSISELSFSENLNAFEFKEIEKIDESIEASFLYNNKLHLMSSKSNIYTFEGSLKLVTNLQDTRVPDKIVTYEDRIIFINGISGFKIYNSNFVENETVLTGTQNYCLGDFGQYFKYKMDGNIIVLEEFDYSNILKKTYNFEIDPFLRINQITSAFLTSEKLLLFGNNKLIVEFNKKNSEFKFISGIRILDEVNNGNINFSSPKYGAYPSTNSLLYTTDDGGVTWNHVFKNDEMKRLNYHFNTVEYFDSTTFIAFSDGIDGTFYTSDNGKSYITLRKPSNNSKFTEPFINKVDYKTIFLTTYYGLGTGYGLHVSNYDIEFNSIKDTFLIGYYIYDTVMLDTNINVLVYVRNGNKQIFSIIKTDLSMSKFEYDDKLKKYDWVHCMESIGNDIYIIVNGIDISPNQYLLRTNFQMDKIDTLKQFDNRSYYDMKSNDNKLYIRDTTNRIYNYNLQTNELETIVELDSTIKFWINNVIFEDVVYTSYKNTFLKFIKIPEFSTKTSVGTEAIPSFYIYSTYPNPAKNKLNIKLDYDISIVSNEIELKLYDINGTDITNQISYSIENEGIFGLHIINDISTLNTGVYFIQIKLGNKVDSLPFVVE